MEICSCLVEWELGPDCWYAHSGLMFLKKYVLITGNFVMSQIWQLTNSTFQQLDEITGRLHFFRVRSLDYRITYNHNNTRIHREACGVGQFVSKNILFSSQKYLREWHFHGNDDKYGSRQILSLFIILQLDELAFDPFHLLTALRDLQASVEELKFLSGQDVFTRSTPFGNKMFLDSYNQGVISNIFGENLCLLLVDCPTAPGSEGGPLFLHPQSANQIPIGILISCLHWRKGAWMGLSLVANLNTLLMEMLEIIHLYPNQNLHHLENPNIALRIAEKSLVQVVSGYSWGTGILLSKKKGLFITNSHVIATESDITLHWRNTQLRSHVLFKNEMEEVYDVAILKCDQSLEDLDMVDIEVSQTSPQEGEEVYAAGYPLFESKLNLSISITKGHVSQITKSQLKTTCNVIPGSSGGAILTPNGKLAGIIVSNVSLGDFVYPRVNMAIPSLEIYHILEKFILTDDLQVLKLLYSEDPVICKPWNRIMGKL